MYSQAYKHALIKFFLNKYLQQKINKNTCD